MTSDLLGEIRREIDERLLELQPAVAEYEQLLAAAAVIENEPAERSAERGEGSDGRTAERTGRATGGGVAEAVEDDARGQLNGDVRSSARAGARGRRGSEASQAERKEEPSRRRPGESERDPTLEAILGALEHGSHTVAELTVVTGEGAPRINRDLRRLVAVGAIAKTEREGKLAWSLATGD